MDGITIALEDGARHGRYVARVEGREGEAELTFTHRGPGLISADHTGAPESMHGTGAARALVDHLIAEARRAPFKVIPLCPYIRKLYADRPDWSDVFTVGPGETPIIRI